MTAEEPAECIAGQMLQGHKKPHECPAFGVHCTPGAAVGRADGLVGRGLRGLLSISPQRRRETERGQRSGRAN